MENDFYNRDSVGVQDFVLLEDYRSEDAFVDNLRKRFQEDLIYTYIGSVLVSVNPYKELKIYDARHMERYRGQNFYELPPHLYAIADTAYRAVIQESRSECILISGESGSGKTEATKKILQFIAQASKHHGNVDDIKDKLLACTPLFEAFGNAKTTRNDNSSRFGKYMDVEVGVEGFPVGGNVLDYLLERTRVVFQAPGERNFHIFYQLLKGADSKLLGRLKLTGNWRDYYYLNQGAKSGKSNDDDVMASRWKEEYFAIQKAMDIVSFSTKERDDLLTTVAAVLHLGNVEFEDGSVDSARITNSKVVTNVADLLGCAVEDLVQTLTHRGVHARSDKVLAKFSREQAVTARDSLAKAVYAKTFEFLVKRVNKALAAPNKQATSAVIGLLDIYGFEIFEINSFEQFCINYCNEKLQQLFIELTLRSEQEEYVAEGIKWEAVDYFDNDIICNLIEAKPSGIIPILDDECLRPGKATSLSFLEQLRERYNKHPHLSLNKDKLQFTVKHYAGSVTYNIDGFLEKNGELLHRDQKELLLRCTDNEVLRAAFTEKEAVSLKRAASTATQFKNSLAQLMVILKSKDPFYVRCIRPNDHKSPRNFNDTIVRHQVKYLGLVENLRVRRAGYAYRRLYTTFLQRYKSLCPQTWPVYRGDPRNGVQLLMSHLQVPNDAYSLGKSKLFVRVPKTIFEIEDAFQRRKHDLVTRLIAWWRCHHQRKVYLKTLHDIVVVQTQVRGHLAAKRLKERRKAAHQIREFIKGFITRHEAINDVNRKFWIQTRINYLNRVARGKLPVSVLDKSWPTAPPSLQLTSDLLRKLHMKNRILKYCKGCSTERKMGMEEKILAEKLFKGKKAIYPSSVAQMFAPVRLGNPNHSHHWKSRAMHFEKHLKLPTENTLYATDCVKFDRHGFKQRERAIIMTTQNLYFLEASKDQFSLKNAYPLETIEAIIMSANQDSVVIISTKTAPPNAKSSEPVKNDFVFQLPNLVEFVTKFVWTTGKTEAIRIIPNNTRYSLESGGSNGTSVLFGTGNNPSILGVKKTLSVVAHG